MTRTDLLKKLTDYMLLHNYSHRTIKSYGEVVSNYFSFVLSHPSLKDAPHNKRMEVYLTHRVKSDNISPSTQNVEWSALIVLHRDVMGIEIKDVHAERAKYRQRIPPILGEEQVLSLIQSLPCEHQLIGWLMYGVGLRVNEALRLRIKDVDLKLNKLCIHEAKGNKERILPIPESIAGELKKQIERADASWQIDKKNRHGVHLSRSLMKKYPQATYSKEWYWIFPAPEVSIDPYSQRIQRHHVYDFAVQKSFLQARRKLKLPEYATPHSFRHAFATHLAQSMLERGFPQSMIEAEIMKYLGHATRETLKFYLYLAAPKDAVITLPIEKLKRRS